MHAHLMQTLGINSGLDSIECLIVLNLHRAESW